MFGLRVQGDCCAPHILDGGAVHVDLRAEPQADDFVAIFFEVERAGQRVMQGWVKRLSVGLPRDMQWPFRAAPGNELLPVLMVESLNPSRCYTIDVRHVHAVFKVVDILPPAEAIVWSRDAAAAARR